MAIKRRIRTPLLRPMYEIELPPTTRRHDKERDIQKTCIEWLNTLPGVSVWRRNVGAMEGEHKGVKRWVRFGEKGEADICGIGPFGTYISIEVKGSLGKLRDDQIQWLAMIKSRGGIAFAVNSVESCVSQMRDEFRKRGFGWAERWEL